MKLLLTSLILGIGIFFLTSSSCERPGDEMKETAYLSDSLKAYCDFQVGSYWIYQDSVSKKLDSVYVYMRNTDIRYSRYLDKDVESIISFYKYGSDTVIKKLIYDFGNDYYFTVRDVKVDYNYDFPVFVVEKSPIFDNDINTALTKTYHSNLRIGNKLYKNVVKFNYMDNSSNSEIDDSYHRFRACYFVKGIGMVKQEYRDGRIFELVRYQVQQ